MQISAAIHIRGKKPLLFHTFPIEALNKNASKSGNIGDDSVEWKKTVLMTPERELYIYNSYLVGAVVEGGKQIKVGKGTLNKKLRGTLEVLEPKLMLGLFVPPEDELTRREEEAVYLDVRSVVNPMTKGRNIRYRIAAKAGWEIKATLLWDDKVISFDQVKDCAENGGLFEGIGDGRRIGFGRFDVLSFKRIMA